jgi:uncharacterized repeat protein (TIGR01451 family)/gliding motility-associated-like protein
MENIILNALKRFRFLGIVFLFTYSYQINAQCGTPVVGCPGTDFGNFGYNSNNNSATIEYDNFVSTFHSTVVRDADGNFQVWGENVGHHATNVNSFSNLLDPLVINTTNFPGFTGTPLKAALGSVWNENVQGILLTTTGLHVWGRPGVVVATSLTTNWRMQPITVGGNTNGLPTGVTPAMVKMMFVTGRTIAITTCDGDAYVLSQNATLNQGGSSTAWTRVQDSSNNNLTGVVALRGSAGVMFALKSDNTLWTWGINTYLGDGSAFVATRNRAKQMTAPITGINIKMIGATFSGIEPAGYPTYYVLATDGNLYSMGRNNQKQIGDWAGTSTHRTSWVQPRYTSASGQVMNNIKWISPAEHDWELGAINVITNNADLYNWGSNTNNRYMLGRGTTENVDPGIPNGSLTDDILAVETGGHTTMITMKCTENFGYVGHRVRGSMGNGSGADANEQSFTFATAAVQICGAETIPIVHKITINMNSDGTVCEDGAVTLVPDVPGGTYSFYTAVPGSPGYSFYDPTDPKRNIADGGIANFSNGTNGTPGDSTNTLTFNGTGTVKVVYSVTGDCGPVEVVTTDFVVDCVADLEITKSVSPTNANAGDTVTFTINVENLGPQRAKEVQVTELLPAGYTYVNHAVSTGSYNNTTGLWDGFYLIDGNSATLTVTATVNANGPYLNTATISSGTPDPNLTNNEDTAAVTIPTADLAIEKTVSNATPNVGDTITFTLAVTNNGTVNAANVSISDVVPNGYTIGTINNGGVNTAGTITWSIANLANGATTTVTFTVTVNATGNYANTATVSSDTPDSDLTNNEDSVTTTPVTPNTTHAVNDINNTYANTSVSGSVATNDFDTEGHAQTYTPIDTTDANGNHLVLNSDGTYTFTPGTDFTGTLVYTYTVCDNGTPQACDTATLTIEVLPLPEPSENTVTANNDTATTESGQAVNINVVANDFDMEGDAFTVTSNTQPANGTLVNNGDGTFTYTPNAGFEGVDTFTYTICDDVTPTPACDTATVAITVLPNNGVNDTYANDDTFNGNQGTVITGNVLTNDVDPEGNIQTVSSNTQPANGVVVMNPNTGEFTYTPNDPDFTGTDQFTYTVCDNGTPQACDTATVYITVNPVYIPQADLSIVKIVSNATPNVGDVVTFTLAVTNNGTDNAANVVISDVVPNGYTIGTINNGGVNTAGTITWTIANLANGANTTVTFTTTVNATGSYNNTATVTSDTQDPDTTNNTDTVTVTPANTTIAEDDINNTYVNTPVSGSVATNDKDAEGHTTTYTPIDNTDANGNHLVLNSDGTYTFTPGDNFTGTLVYTYTVCDNGTPQACDTATLTIEVLPLPEPGENTVTANHDTATTEEGQPVAINVVANDFDMESNTFTVTTNTNPTNGTVVNNGDGTFTYTPNPGFEGIDTFTYTICDDQTPAACDTATVTVTVLPDNGENDTYANDDAFNGNQGTVITGNVLTNDVDPEGNTQTVASNTQPANGVVVMNPNTGEFTYTPNDPDFTGTDQFTYTVCDNGTPQACDTATVYITVNPVYIPQADLSIVKIVSNATPNVGDVVTFTLAVTNNGTDNAANVVISDVVPNGYTIGTINNGGVNTAGTITWTIANLANGANTTVTFTTTVNATGSYNNTATVTSDTQDPDTTNNTDTVTVTPANTTIAEDDINNTYVNTPVSGSVATNDKDAEGHTTTYTPIDNTDANGNHLVLNSDGTYTFTPGDNFTGTLVYTYTVCDNGTPQACDTATLTIEVLPLPEPGENTVTANHDTATTEEGQPVAINVVANDFDMESNTFTVTTNTNPTNGTVVNNGDGTFTYTPNPGFEGIDTFTYTICDDQTPAACDTATVTVTVLPDNGENDTYANDDAFNGNQGTVITGNVLTNDVDPEGNTQTVASNTQPANGVVVMNPNTGEFTYTPNDPDFTGTDQFTYTVCDNGTPQACDTATVYITVNPVYIPQADLSIVKIVSNATPNVGDVVTFTLAVTNNGTDNAANVVISDVVPNGYTIGTINNGGVNTAGTITWTIANLANGANTTVTFTTTVNATGSYNNTATVTSDTQDPDTTNNTDTVTVTPANTTIAEDDINNTYVNTPVSGSVATNDKDAEGHTTTYTPIDNTDANGNHLVLNSDGTYTFTPGDNFTGTLVYTYTVCDNGTPQACDTATLTIEVLPLPEPGENTVTANHDTATTEEGQPVAINVVANDFDMESNTFTVTTNTNPTNGTVVNNGDGTFTYTPNPGFEGIDTFTYTICDDQTPAACDTATVTVTVLPDNGENDTYANDDAFNGNQGTPITGSVLTNDTDPEGNIQTVIGNTNPANGTVVMNPEGAFTYTPTNPNFSGTDQFTYTVCDNGTPQACDTATVYITVNPVTPLIELTKDGAYADTNGDGVVNVGDSIVYNFTVTNTGNVTVSNLTIDDAVIGVTGLVVTPSILAPGAVGSATTTYAITQANIDNGGVHNIATANGTDPNNNPVSDNSNDPTPLDPTSPDYDPTCPTCTFTDLQQTPLIELLKDGAYADTNGDGVVNVGDSIVYNFTVTNTGNVTVSNLTIDDAVIGVTGLVVTPSILAPGAVGSATTTYAITQANIDNGGVHNIATANGTDPNNNPVSDNSNDPTPLDPTSPDYDPTCPTCTFTDLQQTPLIELLKDGAYADTNGDGVVNVGDSIVYNFTVTNTGNVTVSNLTIDDAVIGVTGLVVTPSILAPGAVGSATTTYAITQANIDNGGVHNIATANGTDPNNNPVSDNSNDPTPLDPTSPDYDPTCPTCTFTDLQQTPLIELLKDGAYADTNGDGVVNVGDSIVYNFTVTNTGNVTVSNLTIDDAVIGVTGLVVTPSILAPGAVGSATTTYAITQANIDNGGVHNIATANGTDPNNNPVSDNSNDPTPLDPTSPDYDPTCPTCTFTDLQQTPLIELLKDGAYADTNGDGVVNVGDSIVYNFTVTNTGNVTVSNLTIDDAVIGVTGLAVTPSTLAPGQSGTATATYAITQADIDNGGVHNIATANGTDPNNNPVSDNSNDPTPLDPTSPDYDPTCPTCTFTDLQQTPLIELLKDGAYADTNGDGVVNVGDSIVYNFTVTNTGNVTVSNLTIDDAVIGVTGLVVTPSILAPGAVGSATTTYAITQANIDNGGVHNIATANGTDPNNNPVSDNSNDPTPLDPTSPDYDPTCPTCTFTDLQQTPLIELLKDGAYADTNGDGVVNVGDSIVYNFTVTNTGNVTVSNLTIDDAVIGVTGLVVTPSILAPGAVGSATTTYAITQANIDNGGVHNIATANGTDPNNNPVSDNSNDPTPLDPTSPDYDPTCPTCTFTDLQQTPLIELLKDGAYADTNGDGVVNVGDSIVYNFTVTNTGNVTVSNLTIDDAVIGVTGLVVTPSILAPGAVGSATTTYAITQANIDNGGVHNIATANGTDPNNNPVSDNSNDPTPLDPTSPDYDPTCPTCTFTDLQQTPLIELLKDGAYADTNGDGVVNVGDSIVYNFTVTNTGNVTVSNLTIDDAVIGVTGLAVTPSTLAPGQSGTATATYAITQADIDNGGVHNIATANGTDPNNNPVSDNSNDPTPLDPTSPDYDPTCPTCTFTDLQQTPLIELLKDGAYADTNGDGVVNVGDSIVYNFTVTNTGNVTVSNLTIDDAVIGVTGLVVTPSILAPGAVGSATTTYAITQEDIDLGQVLNIAYANGTDPNGDIVFDDSEDPTPFDPNDSTTIVILDQTSAIALVKEGYFNDENGDGYAQPGETITYSFVATNTGNTTLNNVVVVETNFSGAGSTPVPTFVSATFGSPEGTLLVGESATYIAVYIIVGQDLANGSVINEAIVTATDTNDTSVSDTSDDPNDLNNIDADDDGDPDDPTVIELPDGCKIIVNNGVSPNGDGINDYLHIYGLGCYSSNEIEIFNRWGVKVFETKNYENSDINGFKGISNGRTTINQGDGLPTGHYWYVLKYLGFDGKNHSKTGYIYVSQ